jgi:hypothetical protein
VVVRLGRKRTPVDEVDLVGKIRVDDEGLVERAIVDEQLPLRGAGRPSCRRERGHLGGERSGDPAVVMGDAAKGIRVVASFDEDGTPRYRYAWPFGHTGEASDWIEGSYAELPFLREEVEARTAEERVLEP